MTTIVMPRLSDSMEEGTIIRWLRDDGEHIAVGDELVEIETDKATVAYESELAGVLAIVANAGQTLPIGAVIGEILSASAAGAPRNGASAAAARTPGRRRAKASPVARRLAGELGVDVATLVGTGPAGRIVKRDVEAARPARPAPVPGDKGVVQRQATTSVQETIARRMTHARATIPEFTLTTEAGMDEVLRLRAQLEGRAVPSINDFVVKACALALREHPKVNGSYADGAFELYGRINVGVAVAVPDALLVPTVFDADLKALGQIATETRSLAERGRAGTLTPAELSGGTFTVSNLGMYGITHFTAVLNPPQAAILAVGSVEERLALDDSAVVARRTMSLTLTCDHRILYGADAAAFLRDVRAGLEQPLRLAL